MQRHFSDILRCVAVCEIYYYGSSQRLYDTETNDIELDVCVYVGLMLESFIGHVCRTLFLADSVNTTLASLYRA